MAGADDEPNKPAPPVDTPQSGDKPLKTQTLRPKHYEDKGKSADDPLDPGYQTARVEKKLDQLERGGVVLSDYTPVELRRLLEQKFKDDEKKLGLGLATPSRQVMNTVIKLRKTAPKANASQRASLPACSGREGGFRSIATPRRG
jgi:hypothetical protein